MRLRVLLAALAIAASLAGAASLHAAKLGTPDMPRRMADYDENVHYFYDSVKADWQDPAAVALAVLGAGVAGAILVPLARGRD